MRKNKAVYICTLLITINVIQSENYTNEMHQLLPDRQVIVVLSEQYQS